MYCLCLCSCGVVCIGSGHTENNILSVGFFFQGDNNLLKQQLEDVQNQLNHQVANLIHPEEVLARINELKQKLQTGDGEIQ